MRRLVSVASPRASPIRIAPNHHRKGADAAWGDADEGRDAAAEEETMLVYPAATAKAAEAAKAAMAAPHRPGPTGAAHLGARQTVYSHDANLL